METNLKDFLFEDDYENLAQEFISLRDIKYRKDFLDLLIDKYHEKKSLPDQH